MNDPEQRDRILDRHQHEVQKAVADLHLGKRWNKLEKPEVDSLVSDLEKTVITEVLESDAKDVKDLLAMKDAYKESHPYKSNCDYRLPSKIGDSRTCYTEWNRMMFLTQQYDWTGNQNFENICNIYPQRSGAAGLLAGSMLRSLAVWKQYGICGQNYEENPTSYPPEDLLKVSFDDEKIPDCEGYICDPRPSGSARFTTSSFHVMSDVNVSWRKYLSEFNPDRSRCSFSQDFIRTRLAIWTETKMLLDVLEIPDSNDLVDQFENDQTEVLLQKVSDNIAKFEDYRITPKGIVVDFIKCSQSYNRDRQFSNSTDGNILNYKLRPIFDEMSGNVAELPIANEKFNFYGNMSPKLVKIVKILMERVVHAYLFAVKYGERYRRHVRIFKKSKKFIINQVYKFPFSRV